MKLHLESRDSDMLNGVMGEATRFAMSVIVRMAEVEGAGRLRSVEQAHIDACALMSQSNLDLITHLLRHGGQVRVPTTLNMVSLDLRNWEALSVPEPFARMATEIADSYLSLGCVPTWTCSPYQGYLAPRFGQHIAWGESNAVVYANSVLGARTNRVADYMDVCAAITGRVPDVGMHLTRNRRGQVIFKLEQMPGTAWEASASWAALGHFVGEIAGSRIPILVGLPAPASGDQLKALGAAAASAGGIPMFHAVGITPEAPDLRTASGGAEHLEEIPITRRILTATWKQLSTAAHGDRLGAVILGCPHFSYDELAQVAAEIKRQGVLRVDGNVQLLIITHSSAHALAQRMPGLLETIEGFGARLVLDTCPFHSPIVQQGDGAIMTNSGKCAYYAPGELRSRVGFGSLADCIRSAACGHVQMGGSPWES